MGWIIVAISLSLLMTVLTAAELWQPIKGNALKFSGLSVGDRVIAAFVLVTFTLAFINGLMLLAARVLP